MANFYAQYPSSSSSGGSGSNASVGPNGAPIPTSATLVAGENPSLNLQPLQTDASGNLLVSLAAEPLTPLIVKDVADGSVTGGAAGTFSQLGGGIFNSAFPSLSNGNQAALQLDSSGRLFIAPLTNASIVKAQLQDNAGNGITSTSNALNVNISSGSVTNLSTNVAQFGGANVVTGTGASGAGIPRVTISNDSSLAANQSVNLSQVAGATTATGHGTAAGALRVELPTDGTGLVNVAQATAANLNATVVQPTAANLNATVVQATASNLNATVNLADVGGTAISLGQAAAATSIPVVTQADSAPATQNVTTLDLVSTTTAVANGQNFITGTPTAGSAASFSTASFNSVEVQVTGTWTGTLSSEISMDGGTTWITRGLKQSGASYFASTFTANFQGGANLTGMTNYRVRATAAMTGTAVVKIVASVNPASLVVSNPLTLRDSVVQSVANTIKAASTSPLATDTALVVAISPNSAAISSVPTGNTPLQFVRNVYSSTNVTTGAYVQLIASTSGVTNVVEIFDSSGQTLKIAFGGAGSEVDQFLLTPGGNGRMTVKIPASTRVSIRAVSATASSGELDMNLYT